ncbi:MAG: hypothetical protein JST16_12425 [Bdellovibrionales bacterium]|nr:hypothetical protein [Bdellovibrionales bacterium]
MKQGIAYKTLVTFSALTFSVIGSFAHAQLIEIDPPTEPSAGDLAVNQQAAPVAQAPMAVQAAPMQQVPAAAAQRPVAVTPAMAPQAIPTVQEVARPMQQQQTAPSAYQAQTQILGQQATRYDAMAAAPRAASTSSTGNSNSTGTQINIGIQNDQDQKAAQEAAVDASNLSGLRMEKRIRERVNEERLMEKIEEDRLESEKMRARGIEGLQFGAGASASAAAGAYQTAPLQTVPVAPMGAGAAAGATATAGGAGASATAVAVAGTTEGGFFSGTKFKIAPVIGYRWFDNNNSIFRANNVLMGGLAMEGQLNRYFGIEGNFIYGRDNFSVQNGYGVGGYGVGYPGAGYPGAGYPGAGYPGGPGYVGAGYPGGVPSPINPYSIAMRSRDSYEAGVNAVLGYDMSYGFRPYVVGGVGYLYQKYNIDDSYTTATLRQAGLSRTTDYFTGNLGVGVNFGATQNLSIGARFDYQALLNSNNTNGTYSNMNIIWGDAKNRYRLTGSVQLVF